MLARDCGGVNPRSAVLGAISHLLAAGLHDASTVPEACLVIPHQPGTVLDPGEVLHRGLLPHRLALHHGHDDEC